MTRTMYDAIDALQLPTGGDLYAGYVDGNWPSVNAISQRFPHATVVRIAVSASTDDGVVLDCEPGNCTPEEAVNWVLMRRRAGVDPTVYCNEMDPTAGWPAVRAAFRARGVPEPHYWVAHYDGNPSIPAGAIGKQYASVDAFDTSAVAGYWPGVDPTPQGVDMAALDTTDPNWQALIWRTEALVTGRPAVAGGPTKGEANEVAAGIAAVEAKLAGLSVPAVDVAALAAALAANPAFVDAIAAAVVTRMGSELK